MLIKLGTLADFQPNIIYAIADNIIVMRVGDQLVATNNTCPHLGLDLQSGDVVGCILICKWHGAQFDICTGVTLKWAANEANRHAENHPHLHQYPVIDQDGEWFVEVG